MEEAIKQIGERLKGLREVLDIPAAEVAETCGIALEKYEKIESGEVDITISNIMKIAKKYGVSADALMFAEEPHMRSYFVTRNGQGLSVERTKAYKYQSLASGFTNRKADVFIVTVEPKPEAHKITRIRTPDRSSTWCSKAAWIFSSTERPSRSKRATASTSMPRSLTACLPETTSP